MTAPRIPERYEYADLFYTRAEQRELERYDLSIFFISDPAGTHFLADAKQRIEVFNALGTDGWLISESSSVVYDSRSVGPMPKWISDFLANHGYTPMTSGVWSWRMRRRWVWG